MDSNSNVNNPRDEVILILNEITAEQAALAKLTQTEISKMTGAIHNVPFSPELVAESFTGGPEKIREIAARQQQLRARLEEFIEMLCGLETK